MSVAWIGTVVLYGNILYKSRNDAWLGEVIVINGTCYTHIAPTCVITVDYNILVFRYSEYIIVIIYYTIVRAIY